ncbi:MAG: recombination mediator RecR, partial [Anaeroplasmataceae bacterium]
PIMRLIESFSKLPSIGPKTAERLAIYIFTNMNESETNVFSQSISDVKSTLKRCSVCHNISESEICNICCDDSRDKSTIMVLESLKDLFVIEKLNIYKGLYHILDGSINFSKAVSIEDLNIESLKKRVETANINEIILACNATIDGEMTAQYIANILSSSNIIVSRIAYGIPVGADLSFSDSMTVSKAIAGRTNLK